MATTTEIRSQLREALWSNAQVLGASQLAQAHHNNFLKLIDELEQRAATVENIRPVLYDKSVLREALASNQRGRPLTQAHRDGLHRLLDVAEVEKMGAAVAASKPKPNPEARVVRK